MCIKAAKAGKNVITEKPAALNVQELDEMEAACKEAGVFFTSHQNRRWDKDMLIVKKAYDEGLLPRHPPGERAEPDAAAAVSGSRGPAAGADTSATGTGWA